MIKVSTDPTLNVFDFTPAKSALEEIKTDPMAGWLAVPINPEEIQSIKQAAAKINHDSDFLVCIGIGGSYLGHRAVISALGGRRGRTRILYTGNSLSSFELNRILNTIGDADFSINVISKSGTTTEPAVAFRILKQKLIAKYDKTYNERIYATTDANKGALHDEAVKNNYARFIVPDNIGGRYSVLTAVGLLPIAVAGLEIDQLLAGAHDVALGVNDFDKYLSPSAINGPAVVLREAARYAMLRQNLYQAGNDTEILATFEPRLQYFNEWWKQLFGESEGKQNQGIFPASVIYTTDLHSLGQYLQQGRRNIFETVVKITAPQSNLKVPEDKANLDELNYLSGKTLDEINAKACEATIKAHRLGDIKVLEIEIDAMNERTLGELIYFFEFACAISAKISGVNPFDQPGVEAYKTNMFQLLGKPGYQI